MTEYSDTIRTCTGNDVAVNEKIIITMPSKPSFDTIFIDAPPGQFITYNLNPFTADISSPDHSKVDSLSFLVQSLSGSKFTIYYELTPNLNPDFFSLKGDNALGKEFYIPFQQFWINQNTGSWTTEPAFSAINIVATENNTTVTITPTNPTSDGHAKDETYNITLQRGQTYRVVPAPCPGLVEVDTEPGDGRPCTQPSKRLAGTHVTSDKSIAITVSDDSDIK
jgi:hypothetical protein